MKEVVRFTCWVISAIGVLVLGGQILLSQPAWLQWFPNIYIALLSVLALPTGVLTLFSARWLVERSDV